MVPQPDGSANRRTSIDNRTRTDDAQHEIRVGIEPSRVESKRKVSEPAERRLTHPTGSTLKTELEGPIGQSGCGPPPDKALARPRTPGPARADRWRRSTPDRRCPMPAPALRRFP